MNGIRNPFNPGMIEPPKSWQFWLDQNGELHPNDASYVPTVFDKAVLVPPENASPGLVEMYSEAGRTAANRQQRRAMQRQMEKGKL